MIRRKFYLAVLLRVAVIIAASLVLAFNIYRYEKFFTLLASGMVILLAAWDLVRITNRFNRDLASFFEAMKHEDHSFGLRKLNVPGYPVLSRYMDDLNRKLSRVYIDQEIQARFLGSLVDHIQVGLVAVESGGRVVLFNQAAQKLLALHRIGHIDALRERYPEFGHMLLNMKAGDQKMITLYPGEVMRRLSVRSGFFTSRQGQVHLYSFQDVEHEVEETEMETWQKLIRVLTHEINNSISPIYSLSDSISKRIKEMEATPPNPSRVQDPSGSGASAGSTDKSSFHRIDEGLQIIQDRSRGLLDFVDKFRSLTPRGALNRESFPVNELFYRVRILMQRASYPDPRQSNRSGTDRQRTTESPTNFHTPQDGFTQVSNPGSSQNSIQDPSPGSTQESIQDPSQDPNQVPGDKDFDLSTHRGDFPEITSSVYPESLTLNADQKLVEQILINLVKNAMEAENKAKAKEEEEGDMEKQVEDGEKYHFKAKEEGNGELIDRDNAPEEQQNKITENDNKKQRKITMKAYQEEGRKIIEVSDNGPGIPREQLGRIFTPFYTTKKEGSGVGLNLSRQIMRMHGGSITVRSKEGEGSTFRLVFRE